MWKMSNKRMPDVLDCLANLSNDEVFTPPEIVNKMLDLLPPEVFQSKETTFLDPFTKSGVFLREITKRLLSHQIPDYELISNEIDTIEKTAIQDAIRNGDLNLNDSDYSEKARDIGRNAVERHHKADFYFEFEEKLQNELNRILKTQVFGIAITELTAQLTRRSLYCSKDAGGKYSISTVFDNEEGNIRFKSCQHVWDKKPKWIELDKKWKGGTCIFCGASSEMFDRPNDLEQHAYEFIHTPNAERIYDMKFTVICGNPPYQLSNGGGNGSSATPIYNKFVEQAKRLNPKYLTMIIPSRWMFGGIGLDSFREEMLSDKHILELHDYIDNHTCFPSNDIPGGVCYFLRDRDVERECDIYHYNVFGCFHSKRFLSGETGAGFIRNPILAQIQEKVALKTKSVFQDIVSSNRPFGFRRDFLFKPQKYGDFTLSNEKVAESDIEIFGLNDKQKRIKMFINKDSVVNGVDAIDKYKLFIPAVYGCAAIGEKEVTPVIQEPIKAGKNEICTETFLSVGPFATETERDNCAQYLSTKFARCLIGAQKQSQSASKIVYRYLPLLDFSKSYTDDQLYKMFELTQDEIDFIETMIKSMDAPSQTDSDSDKEE